jgi:hypothetical protein
MDKDAIVRGHTCSEECSSASWERIFGRDFDESVLPHRSMGSEKGGVVSCGRSSSPSVSGHNTGELLRDIRLVVHAKLGAEGDEHWRFELAP